MNVDYRNHKQDLAFENMVALPETIPFSFSYGEKIYKGFSCDALTFIGKTEKARDGRKDVTLFYRLPDGVKVSVLLTHYYTHGATEWTVWFENDTDHESLVIGNAQTEIAFQGKNARATGILGDQTNFYRPYDLPVDEKGVHFVSDSGRATHVYFPYFDLKFDHGGALLAIGWAGTWKSDFELTQDGCIFRAASVINLKTVLKSGERIRTALFTVIPYESVQPQFAQNLWRSFYAAWNLPKADKEGNPLKPFSTCCLASDTGLPNSDGSISERHDTWKRSLDKMMSENVKVDFRWFDAGWYIAPDMRSPEPFSRDRDWWHTIGTWVLDENKWPGDTFRQSVDYGHKHGIKTLMWFEPERVTDPDNMVKNFGYNRDWAIDMGTNVITNNIGDEACLQYTIERVSKVLKENGIDMYREDNNSDPAALWKFLDEKEGENRQGITECKFILNHYRMWDALIETTLSTGGCGFVDSCASGGGRNDLESMRRGVPLLRSDSDRTSTALRLSMTSSFNKWIPFSGANSKEKLEQLALTGTSDKYVWRASYLCALNVDSQFAEDPDQDFSILRFGLSEWKKVNPYLLKDFYTLTSWHSGEEKDGMTAYCYFDPEEEKGVLFAFRQEECEEDTVKISLPFAKGLWKMTDEDTGDVIPAPEGEAEILLLEKRTAKLMWVEKT
ncbi:MAG: alpha-galactosidase [Clostridia bacterium]|nr:alpha-galactosidase [Clostridia bacterium]